MPKIQGGDDICRMIDEKLPVGLPSAVRNIQEWTPIETDEKNPNIRETNT
jgi:hypothetical protein